MKRSGLEAVSRRTYVAIAHEVNFPQRLAQVDCATWRAPVAWSDTVESRAVLFVGLAQSRDYVDPITEQFEDRAMPSLSAVLADKSVLLADGATGTNYFNMGLQSGDPPEAWNAELPERVRDLHQSFVEAGADLILTNTFGANRRRMRLHALDGQVSEINAQAARIAREVADAAGRPVVVAGSVGPTGDLFEPLGELTRDEAIAAFREQMTGLAEGGADVIWIETMSAVDEIEAAATAAADLGLAYVVTCSFDTKGRTMMGLEPSALGGIVDGMGAAPVAIGANCGVGASDLVVSVLAMSEASPDKVVVAKANCGIPVIEGEKVVYNGTPELMGTYTQLVIDAGARIVGGCCGTTPEHVAAMRRAIDTHEAGDRPDRATVERLIGPLNAPPVDVNAITERRRRRRAS